MEQEEITAAAMSPSTCIRCLGISEIQRAMLESFMPTVGFLRIPIRKPVLFTFHGKWIWEEAQENQDSGVAGGEQSVLGEASQWSAWWAWCAPFSAIPLQGRVGEWNGAIWKLPPRPIARLPLAILQNQDDIIWKLWKLWYMFGYIYHISYTQV